jgi:hypothetical protein
VRRRGRQHVKPLGRACGALSEVDIWMRVGWTA